MPYGLFKNLILGLVCVSVFGGVDIGSLAWSQETVDDAILSIEKVGGCYMGARQCEAGRPAFHCIL
ncbi:MAG: hypothetical protein ACJ0BJ_11995 [Pirellulales bacterium]